MLLDMGPMGEHGIPPGGAWNPHLTGEVRDRALSAIEAIAEELREPDFSLYRLSEADRQGGEASLTIGAAGLAILYAYLDHFRRGFGDAEVGMRFLRQATDALEQVPMKPHLFGGYAGIAWSVAHLLSWWIDDEDPLTSIDQNLLAQVDVPHWSGGYDLTDGLVGLGVYALERLPRPDAARCLELIVGHLEATAVEVAGGLTWLTQPT